MNGEYLYALVISQLSRRFECRINKALGDMGLTQSQLMVLMCIYENEAKGNEKIFQKDIERMLMLSNPAVTGIMQRLEGKGLIERKTSFSDSRHKEIHTTEKTRRAAEKLSKLKSEHDKMLMHGISEEDKAVLCRCLDRMLDNCLEFEGECSDEKAV